jgi:Ca-activated chloride channel family protein
LAAPSVEIDQVIPRDIVLVLDTSGSMEGDKLSQAKEAARYILTHLNPEDRFNVITFSTGVNHFAQQLQPVSSAPRAISWIETKPALGGTNINLALLDAVAQRNPTEDSNTARPLVLLFLTDGLPTEGVTEIDQILANTRSNATHYLRLFAFGVGDDVNTELLDTLAKENRGLVSYVRPNERIDEEVSGLFAKIQTPVLSNLEIDFGGILVEEIYPPEIPDLFSGTQLLIAGRYRLAAGDSGKTTIRLTGSVNSEKQEYSLRADFRANSETGGVNSFIPRLWAARKIGYLLNQIRHQGENSEWVDAVIALSLRYGIITPYTSFLIEEEDIFSNEGWDEAAHDLVEEYAAGPAVGADAVDKAEAESNLRSAEAVPNPGISRGQQPGGYTQPQLKYVGDKTFYLQGEVWIDSEYDGAAMAPIEIGFGSEVYYQILDSRPELGKYLALGEQVIFVVDGKAYQIVPGESGVSSLPSGLKLNEGSGVSNKAKGDRTMIDLRSLCSIPLLAGLAMISAGVKFLC